MDYTQVHIVFTNSVYAEILESELAECGYDSFEIKDQSLFAYIPTHLFNATALIEACEPYRNEIVSLDEQQIEHQNWNAEWESNYDPVVVDDEVYIKAAFHPDRNDVPFTIQLEPNMSFGTGHHPTTFLMMKAMKSMDLKNKTFCDFGAGSGVLAIYAAMRGASGLAIEIDPQAAEAAELNLKKNGIDSFEVFVGDKSKLKGHIFDVIAANINRNAIEEAIPMFKESAHTGTLLLCAGILDEDAIPLKAKLEQYGFVVTNEQSKDGWTQLTTQYA